MKRLVLTTILILFFLPLFASAKEPLLYREDKKIMPASYKSQKLNDIQRLSLHITSLINQGRFAQAAQILNISGAQKAATVLLTMKLQDAQRLLNGLEINNAASTFLQIAKQDAGYGGKLLGAIVQRNASLGARLYNKVTAEKALSEAMLKTSVANQEMFTSLLSAKDKKAKYIISTSGARGLLDNYAKANERPEWGNIEIAVLINSGRGAEILFKKLTQKGILEMTDQERMKILLSMKLEEAAKIIKNAYPEQAARLLIIMNPEQAAHILAEKVLEPKEVKRIIREMDKQDTNKTEDILRELEVLAPAKVHPVR